MLLSGLCCSSGSDTGRTICQLVQAPCRPIRLQHCYASCIRRRKGVSLNAAYSFLFLKASGCHRCLPFMTIDLIRRLERNILTMWKHHFKVLFVKCHQHNNHEKVIYWMIDNVRERAVRKRFKRNVHSMLLQFPFIYHTYHQPFALFYNKYII